MSFDIAFEIIVLIFVRFLPLTTAIRYGAAAQWLPWHTAFSSHSLQSTQFKEGDRVIGGHPQDGAYALYTTVPTNKAAILPASISFTDGVVAPFAMDAAICVLSVKEPSPCMPGVPTPAPGLPYPSLEAVPATGKTLVIYGASSSVGSMTTQITTAVRINVIAISGVHNLELNERCGATDAFNQTDCRRLPRKNFSTIRRY
ncbi:hypothetical protein PMIN06_000025 [Paraphaeosphaeria minitans]|uniref:Zinc-binding dehydrogenase family superfamily n=1 Tax=Paraphaeosphaeria minitans TaxID=565426 RepID=A0A9P6G552_9PLEO|nr:zinc-binding dehydrogenase family superfamily [Paraphaeosphaeria minitans]